MSFQLVIAEKPSVARSIAAVIGAAEKQNGYWQGGGYLVSWCIGHLVSFAEAGQYDEKYCKWRYEDLPILPQPWQFIVPDEKKQQFEIVRSLLNRPDVDFLICDTTGSVLLTTDADLAGKTVVVPEDITQTVLGSERLYEGRSTVGVYEKKQFVVGVPMTDADGNTLGLVLAVMNSAELMQMWRSFIALFFMTSAIILLLAFVASFVTSMRQIQPLTEMVKATRAYAGGDFDVRMQETGDCGEISELAAAFNAMADSLQETERQRRDFIANVSHELKTPMTTIAGYTDGILDGTIPPENERQYLQIISNESRRLSRLVRRMLDVSQLQAIDQMIDKDVPCEDILIQINAVKGALHRVGQIVLEGHLQHCVRDGIEHGDADATIAAFAKAVEHFSRRS